MHKWLPVALFLPLCASAQSPTDVFDKAPPQIDEALRARVTQFYQAHVDGKFRQAEAVVHEESKDAFYESEKQRYKGFRIAKITYSNNFTKAEVVTSIDVDWYTPRTGKMPVSAPMKSTWKYDQGQWWYYIPTDKHEWETPFGVMHPGAETPTGQRPAVVIPDAKAILNRVEVTKLDLMLSSWQKSEDYTEIHNGMPGDISLQVEQYLLPGLTVKIDKPVVHANETARIVFSYDPPDRSAKATRNIRVRETPTGTTYVFTLRFAVPPELEKYLKK